MPRTKPLSEREQEICKRLREFREETKLTRVAFARELGVDSSLLSSYEHGRNPVRFGVARKAGELFQLNLTWLASGVAPKTGYEDITEAELGLSFEGADKTLFSEIYEHHIKMVVGRRRRRLYLATVAVNQKPQRGLPSAAQLKHFCESIVGEAHDRLPDKLKRRFCYDLLHFTGEFESKYKGVITEHLARNKKK